MTPALERAALAMWRARENLSFPRRVQRMTPDDIDRSSGAWLMVVEMTRAALIAAKYDDDDEDSVVKVSNAARIEAVSLIDAFNALIDGIVGPPTTICGSCHQEVHPDRMLGTRCGCISQ